MFIPKFIPRRIPFCEQKTDSACCGPCCLKMLGDYFNITKPCGKPYTKQSLIALCKTDKEYGTQFRDINRVLKMMGLRRVKKDFIDMRNPRQYITPMLTCIPDRKDPKALHYVLLGELRDNVYVKVIDPYYGPYWEWLPKLNRDIGEGGRWCWGIIRKVNKVNYRWDKNDQD